MKHGEAVAADKATTRTVTGLEPETEYVVLAASGDRGVYSPVQKLGMSTTGQAVTEESTVTLNAIEEKATTLTFEIESAHAVQCAYVCIEAGTEAPDGPAILKDGESVEVNKKTTVKAEGLKPETAYTILAAATNGEQPGKVASLPMTTGKIKAEDVLGIIATTKKTVTYKVALGEAPDGIFHLAIPVETLNTLLFGEDGLKIDPNDEQAVLDGKLKILSTSGHYTGSKGEYTITDGEPYTPPYEIERPAEVIAGLDYTLLAAISDSDQWGIAPLYELEFEMPEPGVSAAKAEITSDVTQSSITLTIVPSGDVKAYYFRFLPTAEVKGTADELQRTTLTQGTRMSGPGQGSFAKLSPNTSYTILCVLLDTEGDQVFVQKEFKTAEEAESGLAVKVDPYVTNEHPGYKSFNTVYYTVQTKDALYISSCALATSALDELLASGKKIEDIMWENGTDWDTDEVAAANSADGCTFFTAGCRPATDYTVVVVATDANGAEKQVRVNVATDAEPQVTPVSSELFESLPGNWIGKMTTKNTEGSTEQITFPLQIAAGPNGTTTQDYRNRNRLVCLGFGPLTYYSPESLLEEIYWQSNPELVDIDYGPKWFLQIADGDVITVPSLVSGPMLVHYSVYASYLLPKNGDDLKLEGNFPVTVSSDRNTITIHPLQDGGVWYPSVVVMGYSVSISVDVVSEIVLTRSTAPSAISNVRAATDGNGTRTASASTGTQKYTSTPYLRVGEAAVRRQGHNAQPRVSYAPLEPHRFSFRSPKGR